MRGVFITLEGGEGAGKSTLTQSLAAAVSAAGRDVLATREPGGSPGALAIRALLTQGEQDRWSAVTETLLLAAARRDHVERTLLPALDRGAVVLCDRFADSTFAYQVCGRGLDGAVLEALEAIVAAPTPDLTLLLDIAPETGLGRSGGAALGEDRYERMGLAFHGRVRAGFLERARRAPDRFVVLDAGQPSEAVQAQALAAVWARLGPNP